jgi:hypothetical protein
MEPTTISFHEADDAEATITALAGAGFYVEADRERFLGEDDDEEVVYLVLTDAAADEARGLVVGDGFVISG